jgi:hypothetical protein
MPLSQPGGIQYYQQVSPPQAGGGNQYFQRQSHQQVPPSQTGGSRANHLSCHNESRETTRAEAARRNNIAERTLLARERQKEREKRAKRKAELGKDPGALYHSYTEYLEYFPLVRRERPDPYLVGLLANQAMPEEADIDLVLAIQYAKRHWESCWQMSDLDYVVRKAKEEIEKKTEERGKVTVTCSMDLNW